MAKNKHFTLVGVDGNAFSIMGYTANAMETVGYSEEEIDEMYEKAESGNYYQLIATCNSYIFECNKRLDSKEAKVN